MGQHLFPESQSYDAVRFGKFGVVKARLSADEVMRSIWSMSSSLRNGKIARESPNLKRRAGIQAIRNRHQTLETAAQDIYRIAKAITNSHEYISLRDGPNILS